MTAIIDPRPTTHDPRPTFCTLFDTCNEHLTKDVGLIPYGMYEFEGYDSFVTAYSCDDFPNLKYTPGLRIERVPQIRGNWLEDSCLWLKYNAKKIDVLNLYHLSERSFKQALTYKIHNPGGKIYLKFDDVPTKPGRRRFWRNIKPWVTLKMCRLISTEFQDNTEFLSNIWHHKIICVPNPINVSELRDYRPFSERNNAILYVGRVSRAKGSDKLLEAFAKISGQIPGWKLKLVGTVTEQDIEDSFRAKYPELTERVIFTGEIVDRVELIETYRDAKIFAFPSRYESFGIALTEAMTHGEFAVVSMIPSNEYLTNNYRFAKSSAVDDVDGLAENLLYACTHESEIERLAIEGREETLRRCDMKRIAGIISDGLK